MAVLRPLTLAYFMVRLFSLSSPPLPNRLTMEKNLMVLCISAIYRKLQHLISNLKFKDQRELGVKMNVIFQTKQ